MGLLSSFCRAEYQQRDEEEESEQDDADGLPEPSAGRSAADERIERAEQEWPRARAEELLLRVGEEGNYLKHYFPEPDRLKVFIRGGSSLTVDLASGHAVYESIRKRPVLSSLNRLHYNPSRWWTVFSDVFLAGLIVIVLSGLVMMRGPKGLRGRGGVELIAGILIPLLFIFLT